MAGKEIALEVVWAVLEARAEEMPRKERIAFLQRVGEILEGELPIPLRGPHPDEELRRAAAELWWHKLPTLLGK